MSAWLAAVRDNGKLLLCALGIIFFYVQYDIHIENEAISIMIKIFRYKTPRGPDGEKFKFTMFLGFAQASINALVAYSATLIMAFISKRDSMKIKIVPDAFGDGESTLEKKESPSFLEYGLPALCQLGATYFGNLSLQYIDVPTKILAKTLKPVPVMLMGVICRGKRHYYMRYVGVALITIGIASFFVLGLDSRSSHHSELLSYLFGIILAGMSLGLDGTIATVQDRLLHVYRPTSYELMLYTNLWQWLVSLVGIVITGEVFSFIAFAEHSPELVYDVFFVSVYSALGQLFIFLTIQQFGPLTCSILTTMRKFLTIVANTWWFGHVMGIAKWAAVALVAYGVVMERYADSIEKAHAKNLKAHRK